MKTDIFESYKEKNLLLRIPFDIAKEPILVDVGAFRGSFSRAFARRGWRIYAFEPEEANFARCQNTLKAYPKVTCIPLAVSNSSETDHTFFASSEHPGIHSLKAFHPTHQPVQVETTTLNDAAKKYAIEKIDLLKVDVEGADFLVLQGLNFDKFRPDVIMVEFMDTRSQKNYQYNHHDMVQFMAARGYSAFVSEWADFSSYFSEAGTKNTHQFIRCEKYPLSQEPFWGNLIFIPDNQAADFQIVLESYLEDLRRFSKIPIIEWYRSFMANFPRFRKLINRTRNIF